LDESVFDVHKNGLIEYSMEQRYQGAFKCIGFTAHSKPKPIAEMIIRSVKFDTAQFPVNIGRHHQEVSFKREVAIVH
jgi:predicted aldo/keto reductase-like oxidoreductase